MFGAKKDKVLFVKKITLEDTDSVKNAGILKVVENMQEAQSVSH